MNVEDLDFNKFRSELKDYMDKNGFRVFLPVDIVGLLWDGVDFAEVSYDERVRRADIVCNIMAELGMIKRRAMPDPFGYYNSWELA